MKKIISAFIIVFGATAALYAQEKTEKKAAPTNEAKAGFEKKFPGATSAKWEKENEDFEVNFKQAGKEMSAVFAGNGTWKETEQEIPMAKLPSAATSYIAKHYAGKKVKEAAKIKKADGSINYEAEINKADVLFDGSGNFLKEAKD